jgi:chitin synthase
MTTLVSRVCHSHLFSDCHACTDLHLPCLPPDRTVHVLEVPAVEVIEVPSPSDVQEDYYKGFRTRLLLSWVLSNGFLVAAVFTATETFSSADTVAKGVQPSTTLYLAIVLYMVLALAVFRFGGSCAYMVVRMFSGE